MASGGKIRYDRFKEEGPNEHSLLALKADGRIAHFYQESMKFYKDSDKLQALLEQELRDDYDYRKTWTEATNVHKERRRKYPSDYKYSVDERCYIAIMAYTMRGFYSKFNRVSRECVTNTDWGRFPYKSFWMLLGKAIEEIDNNPVFDEHFVTYRGVDMRYFDDVGVRRPDIKISFRSFLSTSISQAVAERFAKEGTVIHFLFPPQAGLRISRYSYYREEEEVLLAPWCCFGVNKWKDEKKVFARSSGDRLPNLPCSKYENKSPFAKYVMGFK